jgi:Fatty acid desaturase
MTFETNRDVLNWYEKQPRTLTPEFIGNIDWNDIKNHELNPDFVPVLMYMRDVETLTEMYQAELRRTPTGKDPIIGKFMERWGEEELTHGELLNRFLNEAGYPTDKDWRTELKSSIPLSYTINTAIITMLTNLVGKSFTATHMTFGAIHELSTTQGYRRLDALANHPVLTQILKGIIREESAHTQFYSSVARLELRKSPFAQKLSRFLVDKFYAPVGQGAKAANESNYVIKTLFGENDGLDWINRTVTSRIRQLPNFENITKINDKIGEIALAY